ncbi:MAG: hypothetical protein C0404_01960 [Verrucomicrobia bacterium]|nr:hypothetical protein [Verrucomicrobiota bacterium]
MSIKIAVLGTGGVARSNYLPYLSKQPDVSLTLYSRTRAKAEDCAKSFGGRVADSVADLMADQPDTLLVLTKETTRYEAAMTALEYKPRRIFFEKPLVAKSGQASVCEEDFTQARELLKKAKSAGSETAMIFNYRFFEQTVRARKAIAERNLGKLAQASLTVNYACWSHCIDLLHLFGGLAAEITAISGLPGQKATDVAAAFKLQQGATGTILGTGALKFDLTLYEMMLCFERGIVRFSDLDEAVEIHENASRYGERHALIGNHSRWDQYKASFEKSLAAYLDSIRNNRPPPIPGMAGLEELQFEAALRRSIAQRRPVDVQKEFPLDV